MTYIISFILKRQLKYLEPGTSSLVVPTFEQIDPIFLLWVNFFFFRPILMFELASLTVFYHLKITVVQFKMNWRKQFIPVFALPEKALYFA